MSNIQVIEALKTNDPMASVVQAFEVYDKVYNGIQAHNVLIFPKTQEDFQPEETILAFDGDEIVGVAVVKLATRFKDNIVLFGDNAHDILNEKFSAEQNQVHRIANIAVLPVTRGQGVGQKLYEYSAFKSNGHCIAAITENNSASIKAASRAGFVDVPECHYSNQLSFEGNRPVINPQGDYRFDWFIMKYQP